MNHQPGVAVYHFRGEYGESRDTRLFETKYKLTTASKPFGNKHCYTNDMNALYEHYTMGLHALRRQSASSTSFFRLLLVSIAFYISGCSNTPIKIAQNDAEKTTPETQEPKPSSTLSTVADRPFPADTLYALLVAEMAIDRKRYDIALGNYVQQAIQTRDLEVTKIATHIARSLRARKSTLEMAQLWRELDPSDTDAQIIAATELVEANRLLEAVEISEKLLQSGNAVAFESIAIRAVKGDISLVNTLSDTYQSLLTNYPDNASLWLGSSMLLLQQDKHEEALAAAEKAKALDGDNIRISFQETRVLSKMGKTELANQRLAELVEKNPKNLGLRARYARLLWNTSPRDAKEQFKILHEQSPEDAEILYSLGLVEKDLGQLDSAEERFKLLLSNDQYPQASYFNLGDIYQRKNQLDAALEQYLLVTSGQNYLSALIKATDILISQSKMAEAVSLVKGRQQTAEGTQRESLFMLEADIYSQAGQLNAAEKALSRGLEQFANSYRLLYARAMVYTQIDYISAAEADLKQVLKLKPENAAALNALGYTLADRTNRYQEAYEYIKQAYALSPDDPAIIDSMGWIAYRLGNYDEALAKLTQAMNAFPDHEIAAHLGEVLWVTGKHQEAIEVWKKGLELKPESKIIHTTLHRLEAKLD